MKIATLYHMSTPLVIGGIPTYLNDLNKYCKQFNFEFKNFGYNKYMPNEYTEVNKSILTTPIVVYSNKDKLLEKLNEYDIVINYFPLTKLKDETQKDSQTEYVFDIWKNIKGVKVYQMHLAAYGEKLKNNPYLKELVRFSDVVMTRSNQNPVAKVGYEYNKPWVQLKLYYDFTQFGNHLDKKKKQICALGRPVGFKKIKPLAENAHKLRPYMNVIAPEGRKGRPFEENLQILSESSICFCPTSTKSNHEYAGQLEYLQMEALSHNCILVLNKKQGESCYHNGIRWIDIPNFALWFDEKNPDLCWEQIKETMANIETELPKYTIAREIFEKELESKQLLNVLHYIKNIKTIKGE